MIRLLGLVCLLSCSACAELASDAVFAPIHDDVVDVDSERGMAPNPELRDRLSSDDVAPIDRSTGPSTVREPDAEASASGEVGVTDGVLNGDFSCVGSHQPAAPTGKATVLTGITTHFGTPTLARDVQVRRLDAAGDELASTWSDDRGIFTLEFDDDELSWGGWFEVSRPGYYTVRHHATHPDLTWSRELELGVVSETEARLIEMVTGIDLDAATGSLHGQVSDCAGNDDIEGMSVEITGVDTIYYGTAEPSLSDKLTATTSSGAFYAFNLTPGEYDVTLYGRRSALEDVDVIATTTVTIAAGTLTSHTVAPD